MQEISQWIVDQLTTIMEFFLEIMVDIAYLFFTGLMKIISFLLPASFNEFIQNIITDITEMAATVGQMISQTPMVPYIASIMHIDYAIFIFLTVYVIRFVLRAIPWIF